jgi:hypothetical protein
MTAELKPSFIFTSDEEITVPFIPGKALEAAVGVNRPITYLRPVHEPVVRVTVTR